tara:strand:- start:341 stop:508 length:168 start_codon:yes stop_codon:yes gene_type:complete
MKETIKCEGIDCPLKEKCYRYISHPNEISQAYLIPFDYLEGECEDYVYWNDEIII